MKKLQIGIYSTATEWLTEASSVIANDVEALKEHVDIHMFQEASEMWGGVKRNSIHILFVDIEKDGDEGIQLVKKINQEWPLCQIVYVCDSFRYVMDAYETKHIYYILKDNFKEKWPCILEKAIRHLKADIHKEMVFQCHGGLTVRLRLDEIMYFERNIRVTYVVTKEARYVIDEKISEIEQKIMSTHFMRCHTSFLVNFSFVRQCTKKKLILENGQMIDISRSYWGKVEKAYTQWAKNNIMLVKRPKQKISG